MIVGCTGPAPKVGDVYEAIVGGKVVPGITPKHWQRPPLESSGSWSITVPSCTGGECCDSGTVMDQDSDDSNGGAASVLE